MYEHIYKLLNKAQTLPTVDGEVTCLKAVVFHLRGSTKTLTLYIKQFVHSSVTKDTSLFLAYHLLFAKSFCNMSYSWITLTIPSLGSCILFFFTHVLSLSCLQSSLFSVVSELKKRKILLYNCTWGLGEGQQNKNENHNLFRGSPLYSE